MSSSLSGRTLIVAEKPSVARDLAACLGKFRARQGYLENETYLITWAIGHLVELAEPEAYDSGYRRWKPDTLPILPEEFRLAVISETASQFGIVARLLTDDSVRVIVNACDAGREGELIFRYIYQMAGGNRPVKRLWVSSLTEEAILAGFRNLREGNEYIPLADAARCRSESDWLVGINATRAMSLKRGNLYSIGRVQTPTLALLVRREEEIRQFKPEKYWVVRATFRTSIGSYQGYWVEASDTLKGAAGDGGASSDAAEGSRIRVKEQAEAIARKVGGQPATVESVERKRIRQAPPLLYDLTELQREMNRRFGFSAQKTLSLAQELYEKDKALTYPRTDSRFLTPDLVPGIRGKVENLLQTTLSGDSPLAQGARWILEQPKLQTTGRLINPKKVSDHHAIIPTGRPGPLEGDKGKVFSAVVARFLAALHPPAVVEQTRVVTVANGERFLSRGRVILEPGWLLVEPPVQKETDSELPALWEGMSALAARAETLERTTKPPPRYTEASLLHSMETAGRNLILADNEVPPDWDELREVMKEEGLGTPATRAAIIERLIAVGYVRRERKSLIPTAKGIDLIQAIPSRDLASPELTGRWEKRLREVERGLLSRAQFMAEIRGYVRTVVESILAAPGYSEAAAGAEACSEGVGPCPKCGQTVTETPVSYRCRAGKSCGFALWKTILGKTIDRITAEKLLSGQKTGYMSGFRSKAGKPFTAALSLTKEGKLEFHFRPSGEKTGSGRRRAQVVKTKKKD